METSRPGPAGETIDTPQHRVLSSTSRAAILRLVSAEPGLTSAEIVNRTGLHPSTVQAHLERLVAAKLLVRARASAGAPGRPPWRYRAATPIPAPAPYRALARALLDHLAAAGGGTPAATAAGRSWGRQLADLTAGEGDPAATAVEVLRQLGFDPRHPAGNNGAGVATGDGAGTAAGDGAVEVHLHTCPFLELVGAHPDVMCGLHAGMIQGVLQAAGAPDGQAVLEPFAAPTACVVRLRVPPHPPRDEPR